VYQHLKSNSVCAEGRVSAQSFHQKFKHGCRITEQGDQILVQIAITTSNSWIFHCSPFCIEFHAKKSASTLEVHFHKWRQSGMFKL